MCPAQSALGDCHKYVCYTTLLDDLKRVFSRPSIYPFATCLNLIAICMYVCMYVCVVVTCLAGHSAVAGASLCGAKMLIKGSAGTVIHWEGGRHHAKPAEASGFCYVRAWSLAQTLC